MVILKGDTSRTATDCPFFFVSSPSNNYKLYNAEKEPYEAGKI